jgi:hypothetical protein
LTAFAGAASSEQARIVCALSCILVVEIKLVIPAVDEQSGAFVAYRMPLKEDPHIPPLLRIVGIASADGTGPDATIVWKGVESDEAGSDEAIVKGDTMQFLHLGAPPKCLVNPLHTLCLSPAAEAPSRPRTPVSSPD